jgi:hypothetical protein
MEGVASETKQIEETEDEEAFEITDFTLASPWERY